MNESLLRKYKTGIAKPSDKQKKRIESAIHELGNKLKKVKYIMKKYKVEIPKGYEIDRSFNNISCSGQKTTTIVFKPIEKELPKTWEEYCKIRKITDGYMPHIRYAQAKLVELRDHYNDGWKPTFNDNADHYSIVVVDNIVTTSQKTMIHKVLTFKTAELRAEFLINFAELIETAKPLL